MDWKSVWYHMVLLCSSLLCHSYHYNSAFVYLLTQLYGQRNMQVKACDERTKMFDVSESFPSL